MRLHQTLGHNSPDRYEADHARHRRLKRPPRRCPKVLGYRRSHSGGFSDFKVISGIPGNLAEG
jgi:hypothetical protein